MTKEECLKETVKMFRWLAENADIKERVCHYKYVYLDTHHKDSINNACYCCEYVGHTSGDSCYACPLLNLWTMDEPFSITAYACVDVPSSPYVKAREAETKEERCKQFAIIADYAQKELDKI